MNCFPTPQVYWRITVYSLLSLLICTYSGSNYCIVPVIDTQGFSRQMQCYLLFLLAQLAWSFAHILWSLMLYSQSFSSSNERTTITFKVRFLWRNGKRYRSSLNVVDAGSSVFLLTIPVCKKRCCCPDFYWPVVIQASGSSKIMKNNKVHYLLCSCYSGDRNVNLYQKDGLLCFILNRD